MIYFETDQDEANFWGRSQAMLRFEIAQREKALARLKESADYGDKDLKSLAEKGVVPELSDEEFDRLLSAQYKYGGLFKRFSYVRYLHRKRLWSEVHKIPGAASKHRFWWILHNCFAHIAIGLFPCKLSFKLHDWTSERLNQPWLTTTFHNSANIEEDAVRVAENAEWKAQGV